MIKNEYLITSPKVTGDKNIMIISDFHYNDSIGIKRLHSLYSMASDAQPSSIVIPGDLYNGNDGMIYKTSSRLIGFLNTMSRIAPIFYVQGNSEQKARFLTDFLCRPYDFFAPDFHILGDLQRLNNSNYIYEFPDINIVGIGLDKEIYDLKDKDKPEAIAICYSNLFMALENSLRRDKYNILICHDPMIGEALAYFNADPKLFDLIITGHKHGGLYPDELRNMLTMSSEFMMDAYPKYQSGFYDVDGLKSLLFVANGITEYSLENSELEAEHEGVVDFIRIRKP